MVKGGGGRLKGRNMKAKRPTDLHITWHSQIVRLTCTVGVSTLKYAWDEFCLVITVVSETDGTARPLGGRRRVTQRHRHDQRYTAATATLQASSKLVPGLATMWHASNNKTKAGTPHSLACIIRPADVSALVHRLGVQPLHDTH